MQVEYATDIVFRQQAKFQPLCEAMARTAAHVFKGPAGRDVPGHKLKANDQGEIGNDFSIPSPRHPHPPSHGPSQHQALR